MAQAFLTPKRDHLENVPPALVLSKIHNRYLFTQSQFAHIKYNSPTAHNSTRFHSCIRCGHSLITQEFLVNVNAYLSV